MYLGFFGGAMNPLAIRIAAEKQWVYLFVANIVKANLNSSN